jgi:hypothetical protein
MTIGRRLLDHGCPVRAKPAAPDANLAISPFGPTEAVCAQHPSNKFEHNLSPQRMALQLWFIFCQLFNPDRCCPEAG